MSVRWTQVATDQLDAIRLQIARSSPGYAQALAGRVVARSQRLDGQPRLGGEVPEYGDPDVRELYEHPYRIIYRVVGPDAHILAVIHSARRLPPTI